MTKKLDEKNFLSTNFTRVQTRIPNVLPGGNQSDPGGFSVAPELEVQAVRANRQTLYRRSKRDSLDDSVRRSGETRAQTDAKSDGDDFERQRRAENAI